jgi:tRNA nucleotidyltransferase/poly(A) polymerase
MPAAQRNRALPLLSMLRRRPEVAALARAARAHDGEAWIVGGALRDRLLGLPLPEIDAAVSGDAEAIAADLERGGHGRAVYLSRDRPGPRVFRVAGKRPLDVAELEGGSIETDLARRDFTVNAMALAVNTGRLLDPYGGLEDLARRRLRAVRDENLVDDPLRALRAARFLATHGLVPVPELLAPSRRAAAAFDRVAPERATAELSRLLGAPRAAPAMRWAAQAGILAPALGLSDARAAAAAVRALRTLDDPAIARLPPERRRRLRLARLVPALGLEPSAARSWLSRRRWGREEARQGAALAGLVASSRGLRSRRARWAWILEAEREGLLEDATLLLAFLGAAPRRAARALSRLARSRRPKVRVSGDDVVRWLSARPGPLVGDLLARLRVAVAMGEVCSRREARHWLSGQVRNES